MYVIDMGVEWIALGNKWTQQWISELGTKLKSGWDPIIG
jgi:hypothetical protein